MVLKDPFASATPEPTVVPDGQPTEATESAPKVNTPEKPVVVVPAEGKIVATFKEGSSYDASWVVVHGSSVDEVDAVLDEKFAELLNKVKKVAEFFRGPKPAQPTPSAAPVQRAAPPGATQAPGGESRQCQHGEMTFKSGVSASTGKTWKAFMCPTPKGTAGQCEPEWIR